MAYAVGIDLGTTNSVVAVYRRGVVETLSIEGRTILPSVISLRDDGSVLVGKDAKSRMILNPESTVASVKRFMGDRGKSFRIGRKTLSPVDVSSLILRRIVEGAKQALGEEVWDAVITIPAYFNEAQREDTRRAGEEAGLNVLRLIPEPTAAPIAYGLDKGKDQTVMVYDLGGGTFDVSIMSVRGNRFDVKAVGGDNHLGGDDFDEAIVKWAADKFKATTGKDVMGNSSREAMAARQRLKEAAEDAKKELSESSTAHIAVPDCLGSPLELELTLTEYNRLIDPLLQRTVQCMRAVLADARLTPEDIGRVILVGGSTKNRAVREIVAREIKEPFTSDRVDEVVAHGAAYLAANLFLPDAIDVPIEMTNVTAHSLGIDALGDDDVTLTFQKIIPRQTPYPCRYGHLGSTSYPNQEKVIMRVLRGEDPDPEKNFNLGELMLPVTPSRHGFLPIGAVFELDADGIIHFTAVQLPADNRILPLIEYAQETNGGLHLKTVDALLESGEAQSKTVHIQVK